MNNNQIISKYFLFYMKRWEANNEWKETKKNLINLHQESYSKFINTAVCISLPYTEKYNNKFRFSDIHSYNYSKIKERYNLEEDINASLIEEKEENKESFIAMEMPKKECISAVATLIKRSKCSVIVSLIGPCNMAENDFLSRDNILVTEETPIEILQEAEKKGLKNADKIKEYINTREIIEQENKNFSIEIWKDLEKNGQIIFRLNCLVWKDKTPPSLRMLKALDILSYICRYLSEKNNSPNLTIVHCMAGVGRTGTYIFYSLMRNAILEGKVKKEDILLSFIDLLLYLRSKRTWMVETPSQLDFLYKVFVQRAYKDIF